MGTRAGVAAAGIALIVAGCADDPPPPRSVEVSRAQWQSGAGNGRWPFTVDRGVLTCHPPDWVTFTADGTEYALTDDARWLGHYQDVKAVLRPGYVQINDDRQPVPVDVTSTMVDRGRDLCPPRSSAP
ncbi:DUF2511 domain-containing protein [Mycobacterium hodleri]|uniref:YebY family protein n=1 Tax=Mycolicibacterium hodleri TaxID=49897 RepID=UPI0021F346C4|nr:YebY family protein [Mycolicibacterium hodleri]MCV7137043.1 DUF2511 domain-containing protein [Mycolicibacterium hodleri]